MGSRWHHGHSLGTGFIGGLCLAAYREWLLFALAFVIGCALTIGVVNARRLTSWVGRRWS